ncbi:hypothetical protein [Enhygromyxa salina]|uniref:T4 bacteriophage base plate protein n=1 Tax=Enhygromyxa salina TaxID=215803 RepID=A0A2S9YVB9_9BACT|nr:hypothetical protein [Enhygromyxa salina]PRQ09033.1 hypothetical protein ENSA7_10230 [Enhygromyxa salina]
MLQVRLEPGLPGGRWACIRGLRGHDEQALARGGGGMAAVELLDRLLVETPGTSVGPGRAWELAVSDRDRLLAAVYASTFTDQIESEVPCEQCGEGSDVSFSLAAFVASIDASEDSLREAGVVGPDPDGAYSLADGTRFRLPTSVDQRALLGEALDRRRLTLLRACILADQDHAEGRTASDMSGELLDRVEAAMELVGPTLDQHLSVDCHECGARRDIRFDIQHFLLRALEHEHRYLVREVHYLACSYGWSRAEILDLSRDERRAYVELVAAERAARQSRSL